jgi:transcriptional regulator with XRE-family HTH domain
MPPLKSTRKKSKSTTIGRKPTELDSVIGGRIRQRRLSLEQSQAELAGKLGITQRQLHKYETGANRIAASRLGELAQVLQTTVAWFFDETAGNGAVHAVGAGDQAAETKLVGNFRKLSPSAQAQLVEISEVLHGGIQIRPAKRLQS